MSTVTIPELKRHFAKDVVDIVADLMEKGALVRRTKAGHLQIKSSVNTQTMSVSQNAGTGNVPVDMVRRDALRLYPADETALAKSDMPGWDKDIKDVALKAVNDYGWTFTWAKTGNGKFLRLEAPDGSGKTLTFNSGTKPVNPNIQAIRRTILQHSDLGKELEALTGVSTKHSAPVNPLLAVGAAAAEPPSPLPPSPLTVEISVIPDDEINREHERFVEHKRPWMAKRSDTTRGDKKYESHAVIERVWSDGYIDFVCAHEGCKHPPQVKPRSVSAHYASQHARGKGKTAQPSSTQLLVTTEKSEPAWHKEYSPREDRVEALASFLMEHWTGGELDTSADFEHMAKQALIWQHEQSKPGEPGEPLTAEQVLDQIRRLVDHGEYMRQRARIDELESELIDQMSQVEAAQAEAAACQKRADNLVENLRTMRSLFDEIGDES